MATVGTKGLTLLGLGAHTQGSQTQEHLYAQFIFNDVYKQGDVWLDSRCNKWPSWIIKCI